MPNSSYIDPESNAEFIYAADSIINLFNSVQCNLSVYPQNESPQKQSWLDVSIIWSDSVNHSFETSYFTCLFLGLEPGSLFQLFFIFFHFWLFGLHVMACLKSLNHADKQSPFPFSKQILKWNKAEFKTSIKVWETRNVTNRWLHHISSFTDGAVMFWWRSMSWGSFQMMHWSSKRCWRWWLRQIGLICPTHYAKDGCQLHLDQSRTIIIHRPVCLCSQRNRTFQRQQHRLTTDHCKSLYTLIYKCVD